MKIKLNHQALAALPDATTKRMHIAKAIAVYLMAGPLIEGVLGDRAAHITGNVKAYGRQVAPIDTKAFDDAIARKYATPDANPILTAAKRGVDFYFHNNMPELDIGFLPLFDLVDMRGTAQTSFSIKTTGAGITWAQRKPGERVEIRREVSEAELVVTYLEFAAGLGILDAWLDFNQFWRVEDAIAEFISNEADKRAALHYGLFTAQGAGIDQAFATDDATTFNNAAAAILRAVRTSGYAAGANAQFDILINPEKVGRVLAMLDAKRGSPMIAFGTQDQPIAFNVRNVIMTTHVPAADTGYYLVLPGRKNKRGEWLDVVLESDRDITTSATDWVGKTRYNAAIGDTAQMKRVKYV